MKPLLLFVSVSASLLLAGPALAADAPAPAATAKAAAKMPLPTPTVANLHYGDHEREVLDFWQAKSDRPTPLVLNIHGGGCVTGDKSQAPDVEKYLAAGISVVSISYRYVTQAIDAGIKPPVKWPLEDAARALQFVRTKAKEWNFDPARVGLTGGSAGACTSLYLAFHNDFADPKNADPVARQSTRIWCAAVNIAQTSLDPQQMAEWTPNSRYGGHAFGFMPNTKDLKTRDTQFAAREQMGKQFSFVEPLHPDRMLDGRPSRADLTNAPEAYDGHHAQIEPAGEPPVQPVQLDTTAPIPGRLPDRLADAVRCVVVQQARTIGGSAVHLQGDGDPHAVARRDRAPGAGRGH